MTTELATPLPPAEEPVSLLPAPSAPLNVAKLFLVAQHWRHDTLTLRYWRGGWWSWTGSCWQEQSRDAIRAQLYRFTEDKFYEKLIDNDVKFMPWLPNSRRVADLTDALKVVCETSDETNPPTWLDGRSSGTIVACRNGLLDLRSRTLQPHSPWFFNTQALPFDYDATAKSPAWDKFMSDLWGDDEEPPDALEEMMGCAVAGKLDLHRILVLVGPPRGGKSLIAAIFEALVGPANTSWASLMGMADDKTLSSLIGKSLVINGDIRATGRKGPEIAEALLRISGQDSFTIDRKYKEAWTGTLPVLILQISNELPTIKDAGGALSSRYLPLMLTESWQGREDRTLKQRLMSELPGILNRALEGLDAVIKSGRFTEPKASEEVARELADLASSMKRFVDERLVVMPRDGNRDDYTVETGTLLAEYNNWAIENHEEQINKGWLGKRLRAIVPQLKRTQPRDDEGGRVTAYSGIRLLRVESETQRLARVLSSKGLRIVDGGDGGGDA